jgi:hypothetical protein
MPIPEIPIMPSLSSPYKNNRKRQAKKGGSRFKGRYMPSLEALIFKIRGGKRSSVMPGSGLTLRPV